MSGVRQRLLGICLPPVLFSILDGACTLAGQSQDYWKGAYSHVNEGSPTFRQLLSIHPLAFVAGHLIWIGVFVAIILLLPDTVALIISIAVTLGHTVGAATWILWRFQFGYQACNALFLLAATSLAVGIRWGWQAVPRQEYKLPFLSMTGRWGLAALLFAVAVYLFLLPRNS